MVGSMAPIAMLRLKRIFLFLRLLTTSSWHTLAIIFMAKGARSSWLDCVVKDLQWIAVRSSCLSSLKDAALIEWIGFLSNAHRAKLAIFKAFNEPLIRERVAWDIRSKSLADNNGALPIFSHQCPECMASFNTLQKLAAHRARKHFIKTAVSYYVDTPWCPCCLLLFASRIRCLDHLATRSPICRMNIMTSLPILDQEIHHALCEQDRMEIKEGFALGRKRGIKNSRACRMLGPKWPILGAIGNVQHPLGPSRPLLMRPEFDQ